MAVMITAVGALTTLGAVPASAHDGDHGGGCEHEDKCHRERRKDDDDDNGHHHRHKRDHHDKDGLLGILIIL